VRNRASRFRARKTAHFGHGSVSAHRLSEP
jgi:hypothetical protein